MSTTETPDAALAAVSIRQDRAEWEAMGGGGQPLIAEVGANAGSATAEGYLRRRREYEGLPHGPEGLRASSRLVAVEERRDFKIPLKDVVLEGATLVTPHGDWKMEEGGFDDLAGFLPTKHTATYLKSAGRIDAALMAHNVNCLLGRSEDKEVIMRSRLPEAGAPRGLYAIVSTGYKAYNADAVAQDIADWVEKRKLEGSRVETTYDGDIWSCRLLWFNYHGAKLAGHGDLFQFGVIVTTSDRRRSSLKVALVAYFNNCYNYVVIGESVIEIADQRHAGKVDMKGVMFKNFEAALTNGKPFIDRWNVIAQENLLKELGQASAEGVFKHLLKHGYGKVPNYTEAELVKRYKAAWDKAPGNSRTAFIDAMTRSAHEDRWLGGPWVTREIESQAGSLVYVNRVG